MPHSGACLGFKTDNLLHGRRGTPLKASGVPCSNLDFDSACLGRNAAYFTQCSGGAFCNDLGFIVSPGCVGGQPIPSGSPRCCMTWHLREAAVIRSPFQQPETSRGLAVSSVLRPPLRERSLWSAHRSGIATAPLSLREVQSKAGISKSSGPSAAARMRLERHFQPPSETYHDQPDEPNELPQNSVNKVSEAKSEDRTSGLATGGGAVAAVGRSYSKLKAKLGFQSSRQYDQQILAVSGPALIALAADPLLSLIDTAFVGQLGPAQLVRIYLSQSTPKNLQNSTIGDRVYLPAHWYDSAGLVCA